MLRSKKMGERRKIMVGLMLIFVLGIAVYLKLWTIDYSLSADDALYLRRQFDLANREAMDESAEWRKRFDVEAEKAINCTRQLSEIKETFRKEDASGIKLQLELLQKEKMALIQQVEALKLELDTEKLRCRS